MEHPLLRSTGAAALFLSLLVAGCGNASDGDRLSPEVNARMTPQERGALRAQRDIAGGKQRLYEYGNPAANLRSRRDPASGLPVRVLLDCCVSDEARAETEAYNRVMREGAVGRGR